METDLPKRKHPRLNGYDYSRGGAYFVTINTYGNKPVLSAVGRGLAPAASAVELSDIGRIAELQLFELANRYPGLKVDKHIIMPTHIHVILILADVAAGASPRPTLFDAICAFKSLTTRICNKNDNTEGRKIFQTSFYEHVLRNEQDYLSVWQYIDGNPAKWAEDKYYTE